MFPDAQVEPPDASTPCARSTTVASTLLSEKSNLRVSLALCRRPAQPRGLLDVQQPFDGLLGALDRPGPHLLGAVGVGDPLLEQLVRLGMVFLEPVRRGVVLRPR